MEFSSGGSMNYVAPTLGTPTLRPFPGFNPNSDCEIIKKAMKGFGCDDKAIINVLCHRNNQQRQQIKMTFKAMYGKVSNVPKTIPDILLSELPYKREWFVYNSFGYSFTF